MIETIVYLLCLLFVSALCFSLPLFPWVKLIRMLREDHEEVWLSIGRPTIFGVFSFPAMRDNLIDFVTKIDATNLWREKDIRVLKYGRLCREIWILLPRSFGKQLFIAFILLFIIGNFTSKLFSLVW